MTPILLVVFAFTCTGLIFWGCLKPQRMYQYPFLAGAVFAGWVFPQLVGLANVDGLPEGALNKAVFMSILCALACYWGYVVNVRPLKSFNWQYEMRRLLKAAAVLSLAGGYFYYQVTLLAESATAEYGGAWTGIITVYMFFAAMFTTGLILALIAYFNRPSYLALTVILLDLVLYFDRIVLKGRRQAMVELFITVTLSLFFYRRKVLPRWLILSAIFVGALVINSIGDYRQTVMGQEAKGLSGVSEINFVDNLSYLFTHGGPELMNAVYIVEAVDRRMTFDFGLSFWNALVDAYVPAQFFGSTLKDSLKFNLEDAAYKEFGYRSTFGSTLTGMSDAFASFWYFGAIKFFIIAIVMSKLFKASIRGHVVAQVLSMLLFASALQSITHSTNMFFLVWPKILLFAAPALLYARKNNKVPQTLRRRRLEFSLRSISVEK